MDEISAPALTGSTAARTLSDPLFAHSPERVLLSRKVGGDWAHMSAGEFQNQVTAVAKGLVAAGIAPGDRVALLAANRYEWPLFDYALWTAGAVPVPIYPSSAPEQIRAILADSSAAACVVETAEHERVLARMRPDLVRAARLWTIERGAVAGLAGAGRGLPDTDVEHRRAAVRPEDTATIVYTSGTTGEPKGCVITHANLLAEVDAAASALRELLRPEAGAPSPSTLLFLPLAHIFGRAVQVAAIQEGVRLGHASNVRTLTDDLAAFQPTFLLAVPRFLEKIHSTAREQAGRGVGAAVFDMAEAAAVDYGRALDGAGPGLWLRTRRRVFDRLVYRRLRGRLGGRLCYVVCGGGKLDIRLVHFYRGLGLEVLEGYGLTETTAAITVNVPGRVRAGTVGEPLPGVAVRVADDSEISARGPQVFKGYHGNDQKTREAMRDGWFATGDLGEITGGRLRITGRKKEIIVTAGGKNVEPQAIEEQIAAHPLVSRCLLVGDGRPFVAALVTIDTDALKRWKREHGKDPGADRADLAEDRDLRAAVQEAVDDANSGVARVESVRKFTVLPEDFTIEDQTLTPTLDLRRNRIQERYRDQIEAMYKTTD